MAGGVRGFLQRFVTAIGCLLVIHLAEYVPTASAEGHCIWYGVCTNATEFRKVNCFYDGPAKPVVDEAKVILQKYCPDIAAGGVSCCDLDQLKNFDSTNTITQNLLRSSPICWENFVKHICALTCSPNQSEFVNPIKVESYNATHKKVMEVDYYLSAQYKEAVFNSCSQVLVPSENRLAFDFICGEWGAKYCTPERLFAFMGDTYNPYIPFQINYKTEGAGYTPLNPPTK